MDDTQVQPDAEIPEVAPVVLPEPSDPVTPEEEAVVVTMSMSGTTDDSRFTQVKDSLFSVLPSTLLENERVVTINEKNYVEVKTLEKTFLM